MAIAEARRNEWNPWGGSKDLKKNGEEIDPCSKQSLWNSGRKTVGEEKGEIVESKKQKNEMG